MKQWFPAVQSILVFVLVGLWGQGDAAGADILKVVTTTTDLKSIVEAVGGEAVEATSICRGYENPHAIQAKPSYMMAARKADLWVRVGMDLEIGYERLIIEGSRNRKIRVGSPGHLDASSGVLRLEVPQAKVTRLMGDVHPLGNPHYWLDPLNGRIMAKTIAGRLAELSPGKADLFRQNLHAFQEALDQHMFGANLVQQVGGERLWALELDGKLDGFLEAEKLEHKLGGWLAKMRPLRGRKIITYHRSWSYFAGRFGLVVADELEPKPGVPPSPSHLAEVIERANREHIEAILMEPFYRRKAADFVASRTGAKVLVCAHSVGGQKKAGDYLSLIDLVVSRLTVEPQKESPYG